MGMRIEVKTEETRKIEKKKSESPEKHLTTNKKTGKISPKKIKSPLSEPVQEEVVENPEAKESSTQVRISTKRDRDDSGGSVDGATAKSGKRAGTRVVGEGREDGIYGGRQV